MRITYDIPKRNKTLIERGLDFANAKSVFAGHHLTAEDSRQDYGEVRLISIGLLKGAWLFWSGLRAARIAVLFP